ncbi:hypothetical protein BDZ45DRAFT_238933 [Acephala macrosclerotiorum]|nr:hypothetical protein BDZ45DRAFT_238933 [Acephala macrosclerotiorum]
MLKSIFELNWHGIHEKLATPAKGAEGSYFLLEPRCVLSTYAAITAKAVLFQHYGNAKQMCLPKNAIDTTTSNVQQIISDFENLSRGLGGGEFPYPGVGAGESMNSRGFSSNLLFSLSRAGRFGEFIYLEISAISMCYQQHVDALQEDDSASDKTSSSQSDLRDKIWGVPNNVQRKEKKASRKSIRVKM